MEWSGVILGEERGNVWQDMLLFIFEGITGKWAEDGLFNSPEYLLPRGLLFEWYKGFEWITAKGV